MINDKSTNFIIERNACPPLLLSDVLPMIPPPPPETDPDTASCLIKYREDIFQRRVTKVNEFLFDFLEVWPSGKSIDFFIALELSKDDANLALEKMQDPQFLRQVGSELSSRGFIHSFSRRRNVQIKYTFDQDDEDTDDDDHWSERDIERFKQLTTQYGQKFKEISKHFKGKSSKMCRKMYKRMKVQEKSKKKRKKLNILSVTIIRESERYTAGQLNKLNEAELMNPIPGYIDQLTLQPMSIPTLSPDGYVLDYNTWLKLLNEKKVNPFTQNHIKSKRELVMLTIDNFELYKNKIVNMEAIQPQQ